MRLLLVDHYDSFTWNLVHVFEELGASVEVRCSDAVAAGDVAEGEFDAVVLSPGPGRPSDAGEFCGLVRAVAGRLPLLGVCLGHQAIAEAYGAEIVPASRLMHGKTSAVRHDGRGLFHGLPQPFHAMRYHSLAVDERTLHPDLEVGARADDGTVMGIRHRRLPVRGVQFHPESVMTPQGKRLLANFVERR